jgi:hypothetical protein
MLRDVGKRLRELGRTAFHYLTVVVTIAANGLLVPPRRHGRR